MFNFTKQIEDDVGGLILSEFLIVDGSYMYYLVFENVVGDFLSETVDFLILKTSGVGGFLKLTLTWSYSNSL